MNTKFITNQRIDEQYNHISEKNYVSLKYQKHKKIFLKYFAKTDFYKKIKIKK